MNQGYFIRRNGKLYGPFASGELTGAIARDLFSDVDMISTDQMRWSSIGDFLSRMVSDSQASVSPRDVPAVQPPKPVDQMPQPLQNISSPQTSPKSRLAFILFGLFLGGLGIHNFYAGYWGRGIAQLAVSLLLGWWNPLIVCGVWIWILVELVTVKSDHSGVPMK